MTICELCKPRAEAAGWMRPEDAAAARESPTVRPARRQRGQLFAELRAKGEQWRRRYEGVVAKTPVPEDEPEDVAVAEPVEDPPPAFEEPAPEPDQAQAEAEEEPVEPEAKPKASKRAGGGRSKRDAERSPQAQEAAKAKREAVPAVDLSQALDAFNTSEFRRTVGGLNRSLGKPQASGLAVRTSSGAAGARITVAWELAWYQWEVGPGERGASIRQAAKGETIEQLRAADQTWNLEVAPDGALARPRPQGTPELE